MTSNTLDLIEKVMKLEKRLQEIKEDLSRIESSLENENLHFKKGDKTDFIDSIIYPVGAGTRIVLV